MGLLMPSMGAHVKQSLQMSSGLLMEKLRARKVK